MQAAPGFTNYRWEPATGLSNPHIPNPVCNATQSRWYRVRMWSTGPDAPCEQTIPVFVTVHDLPRAIGSRTGFSLCHNASGSIEIDSIGGAEPYTFLLNGTPAQGPTLNGLSAVDYKLMVTDTHGCTWDSLYNVPSISVTTAAFSASPIEGELPLNVTFQNQSTQSNAWLWYANDALFSNEEHPF